MSIVKIDKEKFKQGVDKARSAYRLFGPVKKEEFHTIRSLEQDEYPDLSYTDSVMSAKSVLFPQTEKMLRTTFDESDPEHHIMKPVETDDTPRAVIGIKPYDARAIQLLHLNFDNGDYRDPYFCDALEATTLIGIAETKPGFCDFSTSTGTGPFDESALDVLLVDTGDSYYTKIITDKGRSFMDIFGVGEPTEEKQAEDLIDKLKAEAENAVPSTVDFEAVKEKSIVELYNAPFWDDVAFSCINCGTCTFVCPTCWCFDIQDETKGNTCVRMRNWDTCMSPLFTLHASGHNPRGEKTSRVRQRFMHKLKYFLDKYDQGIMCVGCGRCVKQCPVNIDIRDVCSRMNAYEQEA